MLKKIMTIAMIGAMVLTSCTQKSVDVQGEWDIVTLNGKTVEAEQNPYLGFNTEEGLVYGNSSCNLISGTFNMEENNVIKLDNVASTMMSCPDMVLEQEVLATLAKVNKIEECGQGLVMSDEKGMELMVLEPRFKTVALSALNGKWNMVKVNGQAVCDSLENKPYISLDTEKGSFSGHGSVNAFQGFYETEEGTDNSILFPEVASTRMMGRTMQLESSIMAALEHTRTFGKLRNGHIAFFDENGQIGIELEKAE